MLALLQLAVPAGVSVADEAALSSPRDAEQLLRFTLHRLGPGGGPTLLVFGGIQGDEPGGFSAASLLVTHYDISKGSVWVVPNLNFPSIVSNARGLKGDMNRKFAFVAPNDPDYEAVNRVQELIRDPRVDLVLNLHDGSGFYRHTWEDKLRNPRRWGQCIVIDQERLDEENGAESRFKDLNGLAENVAGRVNQRALHSLHAYHIKNTHTRNNDRDMEKTLSYFAVCEGKAAFGLEASKELAPGLRAYYHACLLEAFMQEMGIEFTRRFPLSPKGVLLALNQNVSIRFVDERTVLPLDNARAQTQGFIPLPKDETVTALASNPLLVVLPDRDGRWKVMYGSRRLTSFTPEFMDMDHSIGGMSVLVDGKKKAVRFGEMLRVNESFLVKGKRGYRVNAIGAEKSPEGAGDGSEHDVELRAEDFAPRFSMDRDGHIFRVEVYRDQLFCGMFTVNFGPETPDLPITPLTARAGSPNKVSLGGR